MYNIKRNTCFLVLSLFVWVFISPCHPICEPTLTTVSGLSAPVGPLCKNQLVFDEQFNSINTSTWMHEVNMWGGGNGEFQWYTASASNSYAENGVLTIRPTLTTDMIPDLAKCTIQLNNCSMACDRHCSDTNIAPPIQSARLSTFHGLAFKYGRVEIRAKLPTGDWLWPAIWMLPKRCIYGNWLLSGEIDLVESRGNLDYTANNLHIGVEQYTSNLHYGTGGASRTYTSFKNSAPGEGFNRNYHLYQMEWTATHISFSLDGHLIDRIATDEGFFKRGNFSGSNPWELGGPNAPFDQEFFFVINVAVGSTSGYFPVEGNRNGKPWRVDSPHATLDFWNGRDQWMPSWNFDSNALLTSSLKVDYIKVFAL